MHKRINETKNVSDAVIELSNIIGKYIIKHSKQQTVHQSNVTSVPYVEGTFKIDVSKYFKNITQLSIIYTLYMVKDGTDLKYAYNEQSCSCDYEERNMNIISGYIGEQTEPKFLSKIMHEVNHLYEYDNGMQKRTNLYDKAVEMMRDDTNIYRYYVGYSMYYSFKHEQDAFVHQFYGYLKQNKPKLPFNKAVLTSEYKNAVNVFNFVFDHYNDNETKLAIKELGFSPNAFMNMIEHRLDRLYQKLSNAYRRYCSELNECKNNEELANKLIHKQHLLVLAEEQIGKRIFFKRENRFSII